MFRNLYEFYRSKEWEKFRELIIMERTGEDGVLRCEYSGVPILRKYDAVIHHKIELTEDNVFDYDISLNPDNVMVVSHYAHNQIHQRYGGFCQRVYLVWGSPCAGKTTWVHNNANPDDLIVDIDAVWECICKSDRQHKPNRLKANAFGVRDCLIDQIKVRCGRWRNAYLIGTYPLASERERLCTLLRAEEIFIDTDKDTCLSRAPDENWKEYIEEFWMMQGE